VYTTEYEGDIGVMAMDAHIHTHPHTQKQAPQADGSVLVTAKALISHVPTHTQATLTLDLAESGNAVVTKKVDLQEGENEVCLLCRYTHTYIYICNYGCVGGEGEEDRWIDTHIHTHTQTHPSSLSPLYPPTLSNTHTHTHTQITHTFTITTPKT
jgi:hypothetical protein